MAKYTRKTSSAAELSEACRRASFARRTHRGGRPKKPENELPPKSVRAASRDFAVLAAFAKDKGVTMKDALHILANLLVVGGKSSSHPSYAPGGWIS